MYSGVFVCIGLYLLLYTLHCFVVFGRSPIYKTLLHWGFCGISYRSQTNHPPMWPKPTQGHDPWLVEMISVRPQLERWLRWDQTCSFTCKFGVRTQKEAKPLWNTIIIQSQQGLQVPTYPEKRRNMLAKCDCYNYYYYITCFKEGERTQNVSYIVQDVFEGGQENVSLHFESILKTLPTKTTPGGRSAINFTFKGGSPKNVAYILVWSSPEKWP